MAAGSPVSRKNGRATTTYPGSVQAAAAHADSEAEDVAGLVADFNGLLAKLRTAGIIG